MTHPDLKIVANTKEPRPVSPRAVEFCQAALAHRLRAVRIALEITESAAAAACKVSLRAYRKWEAGGPQRNCLTLSGFAKTFDVSLAWISWGAGDHPKNPVDSKIAFLSVKAPRPKTAPRYMTGQELGEKYEAMSPYEKGYGAGMKVGVLTRGGLALRLKG
jgi:transcriptional regulator with XRE-family HTH domain